MLRQNWIMSISLHKLWPQPLTWWLPKHICWLCSLSCDIIIRLWPVCTQYAHICSPTKYSWLKLYINSSYLTRQIVHLAAWRTLCLSGFFTENRYKHVCNILFLLLVLKCLLDKPGLTLKKKEEEVLGPIYITFQVKMHRLFLSWRHTHTHTQKIMPFKHYQWCEPGRSYGETTNLELLLLWFLNEFNLKP